VFAIGQPGRQRKVKGGSLPPPFIMFYTYIHFKADTSKPFYIGKGQGRRHLVKTKRNNYWNNVVNKHGFTSEILCKWKTEHEALEHEKFLIQCFKDIGIPLVNLTDGGEGTSGWVPSDSWRAKKSALQKANFVNPMLNKTSVEKRKNTITGRTLSEFHKVNIGLSSVGNKSRSGLKNTIESNLKRSDKLLGNKNSLGIVQNPESNKKRSESLKAYWALKKSSVKELL
jgi:hypothetical protein